MLGLLGPNQAFGMLPAFQQVRRARLHVMSIRRKNMSEPLRQHPFGPVTGTAAKPAAKGARSNLHPNAVGRQRLDHIIFAFDP